MNKRSLHECKFTATNFHKLSTQDSEAADILGWATKSRRHIRFHFSAPSKEILAGYEFTKNRGGMETDQAILRGPLDVLYYIVI